MPQKQINGMVENKLARGRGQLEGMAHTYQSY